MYNKIQFIVGGLISFIFMCIVACYHFFVHELLGIARKPTGLHPKDLRKNLVDQIVIVTGSNTGIGRQTATSLALVGATVILACRDERKGNEAAEEINSLLKSASETEYPNALKGQARFMRLDLSDLHSVYDFTTMFKLNYSRLDILVNNAGINTDGMLSNGLESLFQVNYLGHYLLYRCLENLLKKSENKNDSSSAAARVVNLSSVMHHFGQYNFRLTALRKLSVIMRYLMGYSYYDDSKLFMQLLTMAINQRNDQQQQSPSAGRDVLAISVNPGAVSSDIWRHVPFKKLFTFLTNLVFLNTQHGAKTSVYAALIDEKIIRDYRSSRSSSTTSASYSGTKKYKDIPYLIPYHMYWDSIIFELLGNSFHTPEFASVSLPQEYSEMIEKTIRRKELNVKFANPNELSQQLWQFSSDICYRFLLHSGLKSEDLKFLKE
jgi:NAD(P)-dependent dehydrogenase (short-subunit alcohol dehydrogenase family)